MRMKNPPHPGLSVRTDCMQPLNLTVTNAAKALGVTRQALNNLVNGKSGISPEMAIRWIRHSAAERKCGWVCNSITISRRRKGERDIKVRRIARAPRNW